MASETEESLDIASEEVPEEVSESNESTGEAEETVTVETEATEAQQAVETGSDQATEAEEVIEAEAAEAPAPAEGPVRTITFDGGGADGEMASVEANEGSAYQLPESDYALEGATFDCWEINDAGTGEVYTARAGETITVGGDMTLTALWTIDENVVDGDAWEPGDAVEEATEDGTGDEDALTVEYDDVPEEVPEYEPAEEPVEAPVEEAAQDTAVEEAPAQEAPSEVGTASGATAKMGIIAAVVLLIAAAAIAIMRKKK